MTQPKTITGDLIEAISNVGDDATELEFRRLERESKKLLKIDPAAGYMCLGILASKKQNLEQTVKNFESAIANDKNSYVIYSNYGMSLRPFCKYAESIEQYEKAFKLPCHDAERVGGGKINSISTAVDLAAAYIYAGRFLSASDIASEYKLPEDTEDFYISYLSELADFMKANAISESDIQPLFESLYELCEYNHVGLINYLSASRIRFYSSMPGEAIIEFIIDDEPGEVADLSLKYMTHLASKDISNQTLEHLRFSFGVA